MIKKRFIRRLRVLLQVVLGREMLFRADLPRKSERFGTDSSGWDVLTADIDRNSIVYSFGIGEDVSFDIAMIERFGLSVHGFDPTPESIAWVKKQEFPGRFEMHEYGIAAFDGTVCFSPHENPDFVSHTMLARPATKSRSITVPVKRVSTIMKELGHERIDILKMDVEGAEYDIINDIAVSGIRPRQFLVEFHHRFPGVGLKKTKEAIAKLQAMGYGLFSVSDMNKEFCFALVSN